MSDDAAQFTPGYDGTSPVAERWARMSKHDKRALFARWTKYQHGDTSALTFQDAEILAYIADMPTE